MWAGVDTHIAGAGGNGQKFSGSETKKTVPRRALLYTDHICKNNGNSLQTVYILNCLIVTGGLKCFFLFFFDANFPHENIYIASNGDL